MSPLTPRQRMLMALDHQQPDRVPFLFGVDLTTGIMMRAYQHLNRLLELDGEIRFLYDWPELAAANPDETVLQRLGSDGRGVHDRFPAQTYARNRARAEGEPYVDDWGVGQTEVAPGEFFPSLYPLQGIDDLEALETYPHWPDMDDPTRYAQIEKAISPLVQENRFAIFAAPWLMYPFERATQLQGLDTFLTNLALAPDFAVALLKKTASLCKQHMAHFLAALGDRADVVVVGDDLGTQTSLLLSPDMYRRLVKPIHADYLAFIKARTNARIFFHSDGDIFPLIDDLVEIGVDILNPIQTSAGKMSDLVGLKRRYGKNLSFCGAIDTHRLLPHGTPEQVRQEVKRVIEIMGPGGGYMVSAVHTVMNDVPAENILAMAQAIDEYGRYPLG